MAEPGEINDVQGTFAMKFLNESLASGKISPDVHDQLSKFYQFLHDTQMKSFQNQKILPQKLKKSQAEIKVMKELYDNHMAKSDEAEQAVKRSQGELKKAEIEEDALKKLNDQAQMAVEKQRSTLAEIETKIQDEIREKLNEIQPRIDAAQSEYDKLKEDKGKKYKQIEFETKKLNDLYERKSV